MTWIIIGAVLFVAIVAASVVFVVRKKAGSGGSGRDLRRLADVRGWHYSHPDSAGNSFGLSGESMLRGADESPLDWRVRWHLRTKRVQDKERTEFKCADVPLDQGWVFLDPRSQASEIKARQRAGAVENASPGLDGAQVKKSAWREAQLHAREMQVGTPDFLAQYYVTATAKESLVRRLIPQRMQKALLSMPNAGQVSIRMGAEGVVIISPPLFSTDRVEQLVKTGEILISSVAQEQTAQVLA